MIGQIGIEPDEFLTGNIPVPGGPLQSAAFADASCIGVKESPEFLPRFGVLFQDPPGRDFGDVRLPEVDVDPEAVLKPGEFDSPRIKGGDDLVQLLLGRDGNPERRDGLPAFGPVFPCHPEGLDNGLEV